MEVIDLIIAPIYLAVVYLLLLFFRNQFTTSFTKPFFIPAFTSKVIGFIAFACIYQFYYDGGDTFNYFNGSKLIADLFYNSPIKGIKILFLESANYDSPLFEDIKAIGMFRSAEEWNVIKYGAFIAIFCFKSYLGVCLFFALFAFMGMWKLYSLFVELYPALYRPLALMMLFAPSTIFWGSALMKDTLALGGICFLLTSLLRLFIGDKRLFIHLSTIILCATLLISIKVYLLLCAFPAFGIWWIIRFQRNIKLLAVKMVVFPLILLLTAGSVFLGVQSVASQSDTFSSLNAVGRKVQGFHEDHGSRKEGSTYTLGEIEYSFVGFISKIPISVRVALFQPFPWEVKNIVMLLASFESTLYLFFTFLIIYKRGFIRLVKPMITHPEIALCATFTLILGYIVGFTSFNYGALVRFKIPFLPFLGAGLVLIYYLPRLQEIERQEALLMEENE